MKCVEWCYLILTKTKNPAMYGIGWVWGICFWLHSKHNYLLEARSMMNPISIGLRTCVVSMSWKILYKSTQITQIVLSYWIMVFQRPLATLRYLFTNTLMWENAKGLNTVLESPGKPVTGSLPILKSYRNALVDGSPSISCNIDGLSVIKSSKMPKT